MKWNILHESRGRIRLHLRKPRMSLAEADQLQDYLTNLPGVRTAAVLRMKDQVMKTATNLQENCGDILADAKEINEQRAAEDDAVVEDAAEEKAE